MHNKTAAVVNDVEHNHVYTSVACRVVPQSSPKIEDGYFSALFFMKRNWKHFEENFPDREVLDPCLSRKLNYLALIPIAPDGEPEESDETTICLTSQLFSTQNRYTTAKTISLDTNA